jgi:ABC-type Fe3+-hydroxamate transport system substrate-binding protein
MKFFGRAVLALLMALSGAVLAQTQSDRSAAAPHSQVAGTVTAVDAQANQVSLKSDKGDAIAVTTTGKTLILHLPPGENDVTKGNKMVLSSLGAGDRVVAFYRGPANQKTIEATSLVVRTKADLAVIAEKEREDWQKRGTSGTVTAIDTAVKTITVKAGQKSIAVEPSEKAEFLRYAPDSPKFSDAKPSSFAEIKVGDQVRVLGDKTADGATIKAEKMLSGTFRQLAATIRSVDAATGEIVIKDLASKKSKETLTVRVVPDTAMKKLPETTAMMLARRYGAGGGQADVLAAQGGVPSGPGGQRGGARGGVPSGPGDIGQMLDRLPALPLSELKPGDAIMVSTTQGSTPGHITAVMLLAGVEPLLTASPNATRDIMSGWNLGGGGEGSQ